MGDWLFVASQHFRHYPWRTDDNNVVNDTITDTGTCTTTTCRPAVSRRRDTTTQQHSPSARSVRCPSPPPENFTPSYGRAAVS